MNNAILQDKLFKIYTKLPHCMVYRKRHISDVRSRFNYDELSDISIFSANCIGGELYYLLGLKFTSPLINISISRNQFITLCSNLKEYLNQPISVSFRNGMCVGKIGGGLDWRKWKSGSLTIPIARVSKRSGLSAVGE